jgi:hypothetical protein
MLKDMTDSKRIDDHVQSQKPVRMIISPTSLAYVQMLVDCTSNHHLASLLADAGVKRHCDAWTVPNVRIVCLPVVIEFISVLH